MIKYANEISKEAQEAIENITSKILSMVKSLNNGLESFCVKSEFKTVIINKKL